MVLRGSEKKRTHLLGSGKLTRIILGTVQKVSVGVGVVWHVEEHFCKVTQLQTEFRGSTPDCCVLCHKYNDNYLITSGSNIITKLIVIV